MSIIVARSSRQADILVARISVLREKRAPKRSPVHNTPTLCRAACIARFSAACPYFFPGCTLHLARRVVPRRVTQVPRVSWKIGKVERSSARQECTAVTVRSLGSYPVETVKRGRGVGKLSENTYSSRVNFNNVSFIIKFFHFATLEQKKKQRSLQVQNFSFSIDVSYPEIYAESFKCHRRKLSKRYH